MDMGEPGGSPGGDEPLFKRPRSAQEEYSMAGLETPAASSDEEAAEEWSPAVEAVLFSEHLLNLVAGQLSLEDLCRAAMVCSRWRDVTSNPNFWRLINLQGRVVMVNKARYLLTKHSGVQVLNARGIPFAPSDLSFLLPQLNQLESLELEKGSYSCEELACLGAHLPGLTRLALAGGTVGGYLSGDWPQLAHSRLQALELEHGRTARLRIVAPSLTSLSLRDFGAGGFQLAEASQLARIAVADCAKLTDGALRGLLCVEGAHATPLPSLTSLSLSCVPNATDEALRLVGRRHTALARLALRQCVGLHCVALAQGGGYPCLTSLALELCDGVSGANLATSVADLLALEELRLLGCAQVSTLRLRSSSLARLSLQGTRSLKDLELRCARLAAVEIEPLSPGLAAAHSLKRVSLASHALERLRWSSFPALESLSLQCPNLQELDLSECHKLTDAALQSLGSSSGGVWGGPISPGCTALKLVRVSECDALRHVTLRNQAVESLHLSQCSGLLSVELDCALMEQLSLEECPLLERASLKSQRLADVALGTCPRLRSIAIHSGAVEELDLRGCNQLQSLELGCPRLRRLDATFCSSLSDAAVESAGGCGRLEELVLAVCSSVTIRGLSALSNLAHLRRLDLSYTSLEDPTLLYAACPALTALSLSNNYMLRPEGLLPLLQAPWPAPAASGSAILLPGSQGSSASDLAATGAAACGDAASAAVQLHRQGQGQQAQPLLPHLKELDVSYCSLPCWLLASALVQASHLHSLAINGCRGGGVTDQLWPLLHRRVDDAAPGAHVNSAAGHAAPEMASTRAAMVVESVPPCQQGGVLDMSQESCSVPGTPSAPLTEWQGLAAALASPASNLFASSQGQGQGQAAASLESAAWRDSHPPAATGMADLEIEDICQPVAGASSDVPASAQSGVPVAGWPCSELRSLSMVVSSELRTFYLGLAPTAAALQHGLLTGDGTAMVVEGQPYVAVPSILEGLQELRLSLSGRLSSLALGLPHLTDLQLNNCTSLRVLALNCPRLQRLSMQACRKVPELLLLTTVARCPELRELDLQYCPQVTPATLAALRVACPTLETVLFSSPRPSPSP